VQGGENLAGGKGNQRYGADAEAEGNRQQCSRRQRAEKA
jgi:hypothetical protein